MEISSEASERAPRSLYGREIMSKEGKVLKPGVGVDVGTANIVVTRQYEDGSYEVNYTSKKIFDNTIKRFGIVNLPHRLEYFGNEEVKNLIKIEGMKNWNEY